MNKNININHITGVPFVDSHTQEVRRKINCFAFDSVTASEQFSSPTYLSAFVAILVLSGTGRASVNFKSFDLDTGSAVLLTTSHLFSLEDISPGFNCICLYVSREFMDETDPAEMVRRRTEYGIRLYKNPVLTLSPADASLLEDRLHNLDITIGNETHYFYKETILNRLFAFYLDLSDIVERHAANRIDEKDNRFEIIIHRFIQLLGKHYRKEHGVEFYASQLNISAHYLTILVKRFTRQSVSGFIFEMLFSDARMLLAYSELSVKEIASALHFSDQSAFGKFFKRKAGISPSGYRKQWNGRIMEKTKKISGC